MCEGLDVGLHEGEQQRTCLMMV